MVYYKFEESDFLTNTIKANPKVSFFIYGGSVYYNKQLKESGSFTDNVLGTAGGDYPDGHPGVSLYEINVDRPSDSIPKSFIAKGGSRTSFKTISTSDFQDENQYNFGSEISSSYPLVSSYDRKYFAPSTARKEITALKNTINYYAKNSEHFHFSSSARDFQDCALTLFSIPSIFYGSKIKPGTVDLRCYQTGTLISRVQDINRDGTLIRTFSHDFPTTTGSIEGVVLYREGFFIVTGSQDLTAATVDPYEGGPDLRTRWIHFAVTGSDILNTSFEMDFEGTTYTPTLTMFAHAQEGELNHSNNPTFLDYSQTSSMASSSERYISRGGKIKNIQYSGYSDVEAEFEKETYISKIVLYDEEKNVIGIAKLASPIRKRESDNLTFKLKLDM